MTQEVSQGVLDALLGFTAPPHAYTQTSHAQQRNAVRLLADRIAAEAPAGSYLYVHQFSPIFRPDFSYEPVTDLWEGTITLYRSARPIGARSHAWAAQHELAVVYGRKLRRAHPDVRLFRITVDAQQMIDAGLTAWIHTVLGRDEFVFTDYDRLPEPEAIGHFDANRDLIAS